MDTETQIQLKVNSMLDERFEGMARDVVIHRMPDGSFKAYITSSDSSFLAMLIGKKGSVAKKFKMAFQDWAIGNTIKVMVWIEKFPIQNHD